MLILFFIKYIAFSKCLINTIIFHRSCSNAFFIIPSLLKNLQIVSAQRHPITIFLIILIPTYKYCIESSKILNTKAIHLEILIKCSFKYISELINTSNETLRLLLLFIICPNHCKSFTLFILAFNILWCYPCILI